MDMAKASDFVKLNASVSKEPRTAFETPCDIHSYFAEADRTKKGEALQKLGSYR